VSKIRDQCVNLLARWHQSHCRLLWCCFELLKFGW